MMRGSPERQTVNPQEIDTGRRQLVFGTIAGVTMLAAEGALSQIEQAHAAVKTIADFRDRRGNINSANSTSHDPQTTTFDTSQGKPVTVQDTPTPDATVTALQKKQLELQVQQLENQPNWFETNLIPLVGSVGGITTIGIGIWQFNKNRRIDRERLETENKHRREDQDIDRKKRDEDRFQAAVSAMGKDETKLGAATTLRTFLDEKNKESYERFYQQIFDLSVGFLRFRKVDRNNPEPDPFYREIIRVFCESTPLVRKKWDLQTLSQSHGRIFENRRRKYLNASHIHLENADLPLADLSLADLNKANLTGAYLSGANLNGADLREADLKGANPEEADSLSGTKMWNVKNYSDPEKLQKCRAKGATLDPPPDQPKTTSETK